eukprot:49451-Eustigmatos_ZCMA.PRE.1
MSRSQRSHPTVQRSCRLSYEGWILDEMRRGGADKRMTSSVLLGPSSRAWSRAAFNSGELRQDNPCA